MTWNGPLERIDAFRVRIPKKYKPGMLVDGIIYANDQMLHSIRKDAAPEQVANVAALKGIVGPAMAMPDIHWGYGFPIGGVAATDAQEGVISPGGVGFDINCGVRLVRTDLTYEDIRDRLRHVVDALFENVPSGLASKGKVRLTPWELRDVAVEGAKWAVDHGFGWAEDLKRLEENGCMDGVNPDFISDRAYKRGAPQLGSLGAGNHFLEIQRVAEIYEPDVAEAFGIEQVDQIMVMIHTGSRGFGHQICTENLQVMERLFRREGTTYYSREFDIRIYDRQLVAAPFGSDVAERYISGMKAAANFAWANRQMIVHWVRDAFKRVFRRSPEEIGMKIVYDVAHNIAKRETHVLERKRMVVWVHRKGATRAFGPDRSEVPEEYRQYGQPVLIPGDMGTESYVLVGTEHAMKETFGSTCHGAGRVMSRNEAVRRFTADSIRRKLGEKGIYIRAASNKVVAEESPDAYKDVGLVVDVTDGAGISRKVARLVPLGVVKG